MAACPEPEETPSPAPASPALAPEGRRRSHKELVTELVFRPLGGLLVSALLPLGIPPVAVVAANGLVGLAAATAIARGDLIAGALLLQAKTLLDNTDGQLARAAGRPSALGRYLDTEVDLLVNAALFAALGYETGSYVLAVVGLLALTFVLSADFNADVLYRRARGEQVVTQPSAEDEGALARALAAVYGVVYAPQDRLFQGLSRRRLERVGPADPHASVVLAYNDRATVAVLANLGLSTQLAVLGVCLAAGQPRVYLWLTLVALACLPLLQLRRETLARRALDGAA
ncbi:MAG: CDP-alcohol phosphatidyltransferase [Actinobacteria bacterium]|nr:MAG: CDP-alcohol phosphatidyltransferase [Actinomycetota bacterium]